MVGFICASAWHLAHRGAEEGGSCHRSLRAAARRSPRAQEETWGYIEYPIKAIAALARPQCLANHIVTSILQALADEAVVSPLVSGSGGPEQRIVRTLVDEWRRVGATVGDVVRIAPAAANQMLTGGFQCMRSIIITERVNRANMLRNNEPSRRQLSNFLAAAKRESTEAPTCSTLALPAAPKEPKWANALYLPELVIDWVEASMHVKTLRNIHQAALSFGKIFAKAYDAPIADLTGPLQWVPAELLRRASQTRQRLHGLVAGSLVVNVHARE